MRIIIYGLGEKFEEFLISSNYELQDVIALADKKKKKQGTIIEGIKVFSPEDIVTLEYDEIRITSEKYFEEIKSELIRIGCDEHKIKKCEYDKNKYTGELAYWKNKFREEGETFRNQGYKEIFLGIAEEDDDKFLQDKIIADFGCGPRGSLAWTDKPKVKIGIDVLANSYMRFFGDCLSKHGMIYLNSDEYRIPLPNDYVDVMCSINSLDHVNILDNMVKEICRVLKPGGTFLGSFNLNEPATQCEPQTLNEEILYSKLLFRFDIKYMKIARKGEKDTYSEIKNGNYVEKLATNEPGEMWVKAILK